MTRLILDPLLKGNALSNGTRRILREIWDKNIQEGVDIVQANTAVFEGVLRDGYQLEPSLFRADEITGSFVNKVENSLFRERGRPPGKPPPAKPGTAIDKWAKAKGLNPFAVAIRIGRRGTGRWRENKNALGIDRYSRYDDLIFKPESPILEIEQKLIKDLTDLVI